MVKEIEKREFLITDWYTFSFPNLFCWTETKRAVEYFFFFCDNDLHHGRLIFNHITMYAFQLLLVFSFAANCKLTLYYFLSFFYWLSMLLFIFSEIQRFGLGENLLTI